MITELVQRWEAKKEDLRGKYSKERPGAYSDIVKDVVELVTSPEEYGDLNLDPTRIVCIDHGDWQGTQLYVIGAKGYQPSEYWAVFVSYGSCSGCDTFDAIRDYCDDYDKIGDKEVEGYMTLALHILQGIKPIGE